MFFLGLNGVELCGETLLTVTNAADKFSWEGYGLTVHVQENNLPQGIKKTELTVAASTTGQYEFPANSNLVSAVYWFHCEPKRNFEKQLMLEIHHCAKSENASKLRFVTAVSSQEQLPYTFEPLEGGQFTSRGAYMYGSLHYSVRTLTTCGLAIVQDRSEEKNYYARLFYLSQSSLHKEMNFVITLGTDAHLTVSNNNVSCISVTMTSPLKESKTKYEEMNAQIGYEGSIDFESDQITLDIPEEGISDHNGWKLLPQAPLAVSYLCMCVMYYSIVLVTIVRASVVYLCTPNGACMSVIELCVCVCMSKIIIRFRNDLVYCLLMPTLTRSCCTQLEILITL